MLLHFKGLNYLIDHIINDESKKLLAGIQTGVDDALERQNGVFQLWRLPFHVCDLFSQVVGHLLTDQNFYIAGCTIAAHFSMFGEVARTYVKISRAVINAPDEKGGIMIVRQAGLPFPLEAMRGDSSRSA